MESTDVAVILAAGVGSRLRPMTNTKPKCLVRVAGRPILDYQLEALRAAGFREVIVVAGYEADQVRRAAARMHGLAVHVIVNDEFETTNNSYSLYLTRQALRGRPFVLANGDVAVGPQAIQRLCACTASASIAVDRSTYHWESMKVASDGNVVTDIAKAIDRTAAYASSIDVYRFGAPEAALLLGAITEEVERTGRRSEWTETIMRRLVLAGALRMTPVDIAGLPWCEIDNLDDLTSADAMFSVLSPSLPGISTALVDLDGTLYVGSTPIPGAAEAIARLRHRGVRVFFCTNNSSRSSGQYVARLGSMGIPCDESEVVLSSDAALTYLRSHRVQRAYVVGTEPLELAIEQAGIERRDDEPDVVVVGFDTGLTYPVVARATQLIASGIPYVLTHGDLNCPTEAGPIPDAGAIGALLRAATGREPSAVFGKPDRSMVTAVESRAGTLDSSKTIVIGDRLATDIQLANNIGCRSCLVLTGDTKRAELEDATHWPDLVVSSVAELAPTTS